MKHSPVAKWIFLLSFVALMAGGCKKTIEITGTSLPLWEDNTSDSVTLIVRVQNNLGLYVYGQYVNLALSKDSLNKSLLVRTSMTDGAGKASFLRLFPGTYHFNCFSNSSQNIGYAISWLKLFPQQIKDTTLILQ